MKLCLLLAVPLLLAAAPALATGGFDCRTTDGSNIGVSGAVGRVVGNPVVGASLHLGLRTLSTSGEDAEVAIGRSWIDEREIRIDLIDPQALRFEAQLRTRMTRSGATGTLVRNGRTYRVRCELE